MRRLGSRRYATPRACIAVPSSITDYLRYAAELMDPHNAACQVTRCQMLIEILWYCETLSVGSDYVVPFGTIVECFVGAMGIY
jgi:hypothetical protein